VCNLWKNRRYLGKSSLATLPQRLSPDAVANSERQATTKKNKPPLFDREQILAYAIGKPSDCFGQPYRRFDDKFVARLPGPPFQFLDRIVRVEGAKFCELKPGGRIEAEYDVPPDAWYFRANRQPSMPYAVLLEVALQPCGFFSAFMGSALASEEDLHYRNLGGSATVVADVGPDCGTLKTMVRCTNIAASGGMILEHFEFEVRRQQGPVYKGTTYFGFFTKAALAEQAGLRGVQRYAPDTTKRVQGFSMEFPDDRPLDPEDARCTEPQGLPLPSRALRMFDSVDLFIPDGGPKGLGYIRGIKQVDPDEWFFKAHFYQDPVWPGSLGLEAFLQLLKVVARQRWGGKGHFEQVALGTGHEWVYRGQVVPTNKKVEIEACITEIDDAARRIRADGFLSRDGLVIYQMKNFAIRIAGSGSDCVLVGCK